jgi:sporadic carbohydrate cluster protein (TIGR04323 family)
MIYYITPRVFGRMTIPIPIQNAYLRHFAIQNKLEFSLPSSEVCFPGKYPVLKALMEKASASSDFLVLVSIHQLPFDVPNEFESLIGNNNLAKNIKLLTALEGLNCSLRDGWGTYSNIYKPLSEWSSAINWKI